METSERLKRHLYDFVNSYNYAKKLKIIKILTPMGEIIQEGIDK
jgi:hypothetical protein